jgi:hypothetical protein
MTNKQLDRKPEGTITPLGSKIAARCEGRKVTYPNSAKPDEPTADHASWCVADELGRLAAANKASAVCVAKETLSTSAVLEDQFARAMQIDDDEPDTDGFQLLGQRQVERIVLKEAASQRSLLESAELSESDMLELLTFPELVDIHFHRTKEPANTNSQDEFPPPPSSKLPDYVDVQRWIEFGKDEFGFGGLDGFVPTWQETMKWMAEENAEDMEQHVTDIEKDTEADPRASAFMLQYARHCRDVVVQKHHAYLTQKAGRSQLGSLAGHDGLYTPEEMVGMMAPEDPEEDSGLSEWLMSQQQQPELDSTPVPVQPIRPRTHCSFVLMPPNAKKLLKTAAANVVALDASFFVPSGWQVLGLWIVDKDVPTKRVPVAMAFMNSKNKRTYRSVFRSIREAAPYWKPLGYTCDYESAMRSEFEACFVQEGYRCLFMGCMFHMLQSIKRKLASLGLPLAIQTHIREQVRRVVVTPSLSTFNEGIAHLKQLLGVSLESHDHDAIRSKAAADSVLSFKFKATAVHQPPSGGSSETAGETRENEVGLDLGMTRFWRYFKAEWLEGGTAHPDDWAMCKRKVENDAGMVYSTNNLAESAWNIAQNALQRMLRIFKRKNRQKKKISVVETARWTMWHGLVGCIAPVLFAKAGRYKPRESQRDQLSVQQACLDGHTAERHRKKRPAHDRSANSSPDDNDNVRLTIDFEGLRVGDSTSKTQHRPSNATDKMSLADFRDYVRNAVFHTVLQIQWGLRVVDFHGAGDCLVQAFAGTWSGGGMQHAGDHAPNEGNAVDLPQQLHVLVRSWLIANKAKWAHFFQQAPAGQRDQAQCAFLDAAREYEENPHASWLKMRDAVCCLDPIVQALANVASCDVIVVSVHSHVAGARMFYKDGIVPVEQSEVDSRSSPAGSADHRRIVLVTNSSGCHFLGTEKVPGVVREANEPDNEGSSLLTRLEQGTDPSKCAVNRRYSARANKGQHSAAYSPDDEAHRPQRGSSTSSK